MVATYPTVFFDGRWTTREQATVPIGSLAMRYGLSVFEGIRLYAPAGDGGPARPFLLGEHISRMERSLRLMGLPNPDPGTAQLPDLVDELIARNRIDADAYVRLAATPLNAGTLDDPAEPALSLTAAPMGRKPWLAERRSMALRISDWQRATPQVHPPAAKNIANYAGPRLAWLEARRAGFDGCVLTNRHGRLAEAPTAALFLVREGSLRTPALGEDILPSITRGWVVRTACSMGLAVHETLLTREDAYTADEAFLCGTGLELAPVGSFDGHDCRLRDGSPLTWDLVSRYFAEARAHG